MPTKILLVEDDTELRDFLVDELAMQEGYEAVAVESGAKALQASKVGNVNLVIMDVGLPDLDGREVVRILRKNGFRAPIIMLTGHHADFDTILGLDSGANDYLGKPFRFDVLLARIHAQLRQHETSDDAVLNIGPYIFLPSTKLLLDPKGAKIHLTQKETGILKIYIAPTSNWFRARSSWKRCGATIPACPHTRSKHTYIGCAKRLRRMPRSRLS